MTYVGLSIRYHSTRNPAIWVERPSPSPMPPWPIHCPGDNRVYLPRHAETACMRMKLLGSSCCAILWMTLADMGKAESPQLPIMGTFRLRKRFMNLAKSTPPAVSNMKATRPMRIMSKVAGFRNWSAVIVEPMLMPKSSVTRFASRFVRSSRASRPLPLPE